MPVLVALVVGLLAAGQALAQEDLLPPELLHFWISPPAFDTTSADVQIDFCVEAKDDLSGTADVFVRFDDPASTPLDGVVGISLNFQGATEPTQICSFDTAPAGSALTTYFGAVRLVDRTGNERIVAHRLHPALMGDDLCAEYPCEITNRSAAGLPDADGDGIPDDADNCPTIANPNQEDEDLTLIGDICETDASFIGIGGLPGGILHSVPLAVSADGSTVVGYSGNNAFRWTAETGILDLGPGEARAVSADGSIIVGSAGTAFRWTLEDGRVDLGDLAGGSISSRAFSVSADGSVVAGDGSSELGREAFVWTEATGMVGLGDLPGGIFDSSAREISADGSKAIGRSVSGNLTNEAFVWEAGTGMMGLGFVPDDTTSEARAISADGSVVVGFSGDGPSGPQSFRWSEADGMVRIAGTSANLVSPDGSIIVSDGVTDTYIWNLHEGGFGIGPAHATAMSADGSIIVGNACDSPFEEAIIWGAPRAWRSVKSLLESDFGLDLTGWTLEEAQGVSDDGTVVIGSGRNPMGYQEGWVAVLGPIKDSDRDGIIDLIDNCRAVSNGAQEDADGDGVGDACNQTIDSDGDEWADLLDRCPDWGDANQLDSDGNGVGDQCECGDQTGDGFINVGDILAINAAIFGQQAITPLCDANNDGLCNIGDILAVNAKIFGAEAYCERYPPPNHLLMTGELGPLGDASGAGRAVDASSLLGARFQVTEATTTRSVSAVLAQATGGASGTVFGAVVALDGPDDFPDSFDMTTSDVLGWTLLPVPSASDEVTAGLGVALDPGWYSLVLGSGLFGATGEAVAPFQNPEIGTALLFRGDVALGIWEDRQPGGLPLVPRMIVRGN